MVIDTYNDLYVPYYWAHLIIWHRGLGCQDNLQETMCPNSCGGVRFEHLGPDIYSGLCPTYNRS